MKVTLLKTGEAAEFNDSYCERLIEQGKAVLFKEPPIMEPPVITEPEEPEPEEKPEKAKTGRKKG